MTNPNPYQISFDQLLGLNYAAMSPQQQQQPATTPTTTTTAAPSYQQYQSPPTSDYLVQQQQSPMDPPPPPPPQQKSEQQQQAATLSEPLGLPPPPPPPICPPEQQTKTNSISQDHVLQQQIPDALKEMIATGFNRIEARLTALDEKLNNLTALVQQRQLQLQPQQPQNQMPPSQGTSYTLLTAPPAASMPGSSSMINYTRPYPLLQEDTSNDEALAKQLQEQENKLALQAQGRAAPTAATTASVSRTQPPQPTHPSSVQMICGLCGKMFTATTIQQHMQTHTGNAHTPLQVVSQSYAPGQAPKTGTQQNPGLFSSLFGGSADKAKPGTTIPPQQSQPLPPPVPTLSVPTYTVPAMQAAYPNNYLMYPYPYRP